MTTGEKIAKIRKEHNLTQEELGDLLGVTRQSVSKWESDMSFPETEKLIMSIIILLLQIKKLRN